MLKELIFFASYSATDGTAIGNMFEVWHQMGFFSYIIPFLLIFAFMFGILLKLNLFKDNKVINAIISLAVGLIAIQVPIVSKFFSVIFPNLGIALAIILVIMIVAGLFLKDEANRDKWINYILLGIAGVIIIVVLVNTAGALNWSASQWWLDNWSMIVAVVVIVGLVVAMIVSVSKRPTSSG
jgi:hypothetical protein